MRERNTSPQKIEDKKQDAKRKAGIRKRKSSMELKDKMLQKE